MRSMDEAKTVTNDEAVLREMEREGGGQTDGTNDIQVGHPVVVIHLPFGNSHIRPLERSPSLRIAPGSNIPNPKVIDRAAAQSEPRPGRLTRLAKKRAARRSLCGDASQLTTIPLFNPRVASSNLAGGATPYDFANPVKTPVARISPGRARLVHCQHPPPCAKRRIPGPKRS